MKKLLLASLLPFAAFAQIPAPAATATALSVPAHGCTQPTFPANFDKGLNKTESEAFNAANKDYKKCMDGFFAARKKVVDEHNAVSKAHADAAQAAVAEFNGYADALSARVKAQAAVKKE